MAAAAKTMMTCAKCGNQNPLGRVFCVSCGAKMDFQGGPGGNLVVQHTLSVGGVVKTILKVVVPVLLVVGSIVALTLVPLRSTIGVEGSRSGPSEVASLVRASRQLVRDQQVGRQLLEADLNGFFREGKPREMGVESFSVDIRDGSIRVRMVRQLVRWDVGSWRIQPKVSYELVVVPVGDRLRFASAKKGLVPMVGPFKTAVARQFHRRLSMLEEWSLCTSIREIQARPDVLDIVLER